MRWASSGLALPARIADVGQFHRICSLYSRDAGWGGRIRTCGWRDQNPLPYHLATPQDHTGARRGAILRFHGGQGQHSEQPLVDHNAHAQLLAARSPACAATTWRRPAHSLHSAPPSRTARNSRSRPRASDCSDCRRSRIRQAEQPVPDAGHRKGPAQLLGQKALRRIRPDILERHFGTARGDGDLRRASS